MKLGKLRFRLTFFRNGGWNDLFVRIGSEFGLGGVLPFVKGYLICLAARSVFGRLLRARTARRLPAHGPF